MATLIISGLTLIAHARLLSFVRRLQVIPLRARMGGDIGLSVKNGARFRLRFATTACMIGLGSALPTPTMPVAAYPRWLTALEWLGLAGFSLGLVLSKALANLSLGFLGVPFLWHLVFRRQALFADPLFRICAAWMLYVGMMGAAEIYRDALPGMPPFVEMIGFGFIPLFAVALKGDWQRMRAALALALIGLMVKILLDGNWTEPGPLYDYANNNRALGINRNNVAPLIDTALLGVLLSLHEQHLERTGGWCLIGALLAAFVTLLYVWATLPSRASWIAFSVGLATAWVALHACASPRASHPQRRPLLALVLLAGGVVLAFGPAMLARLTAETETWRALLTGQWSALPLSSVGIRFRLAHVGLAYFLERPLTGWGPMVKHLIATNTLHPEVRDSVQFHNGLIELMVRGGLIGLGFHAAACVVVFRASRALPEWTPHGALLCAGLLGAFVIFFLNNLSISFIYFQHGWQALIFAGGLAYGHRYRSDIP